MARRPPTGSAEASAPLFEFCVQGTARTARQHRNGVPLRAWKNEVRAGARAVVTRSAPFEGLIDLRITEFSEVRTKDRDNFVKPIQDAMQGILYRNDRQVVRLESEWRDLDGLYRMRFMSKILAAALVAGREFVWIRIFEHRPSESLIP